MQLLESGFLHADPHPGNLLRAPNGDIVILDFGLMTEVSEDQRIALIEFISYLTVEDWDGVAVTLVHLGFFPEGLPDPEEFNITPVLQKLLGSLVRGGGLGNGGLNFGAVRCLQAVCALYSRKSDTISASKVVSLCQIVAVTRAAITRVNCSRACQQQSAVQRSLHASSALFSF